MKTLIYVPIIHTSADLGSLAKYVAKRGIADLGQEFWEEHKKTVDKFWETISDYFDSIDVSGMKIYQDGMVAEGEVGQKIVKESLAAGSKNYEIIDNLLKRGAILVKTEDFNLVKKEYKKLLAITHAKSIISKLTAFIRYKLTKNKLLNKRDEFIAKRIVETSKHSGKGILFIGAYHNIKTKLLEKFRIIEVKDVNRVRKYQRLLPIYNKYPEQFQEVSKYLASSVKV